MIFGPFAASVECARKRKPAVSISSKEMTTRCRFAIVNIINRLYVRSVFSDVGEGGSKLNLDEVCPHFKGAALRASERVE